MRMRNYLFAILILLAILAPASIFAQEAQISDEAPGETGLICPRPVGVSASEALKDCVPRLYDFALLISGMVAIAVLIAAGYLMMTAGGNGQQLTLAKEMGGAAGAGLVILATAYILLKFLNPALVDLKDPGAFSNCADVDGNPDNGIQCSVDSSNSFKLVVQEPSVDADSSSAQVDWEPGNPPQVFIVAGQGDKADEVAKVLFNVTGPGNFRESVTDEETPFQTEFPTSSTPPSPGTYKIAALAYDENDNVMGRGYELRIVVKAVGR